MTPPIRRASTGQFTRAAMCEGKKRYGAWAAKHVARVRGKKIDELLVAYACVYCKHFHIGHPAFARRQG